MSRNVSHKARRQLTLRFDDRLEREIERLAKYQRVSLNEAARRLLERGAGLEGGRRPRIGDALDDLAGTWTDAEAAEFDAAVKPFERIDLNLWK